MCASLPAALFSNVYQGQPNVSLPLDTRNASEGIWLMTAAHTAGMMLDHGSRHHSCRHHQSGQWVLLMQNRFKELHSLFNVVIPVGLPDVLVDSKRFSREIATPLQYGQKKDALPFQLAKVTWGNFPLLPSGG